MEVHKFGEEGLFGTTAQGISYIYEVIYRKITAGVDEHTRTMLKAQGFYHLSLQEDRVTTLSKSLCTAELH